MFFFATAGSRGRPDGSYQGAAASFVRVIDRNALAFSSYDGNGVFRSRGNALVKPEVAQRRWTSRSHAMLLRGDPARNKG